MIPILKPVTAPGHCFLPLRFPLPSRIILSPTTKKRRNFTYSNLFPGRMRKRKLRILLAKLIATTSKERE